MKRTSTTLNLVSNLDIFELSLFRHTQCLTIFHMGQEKHVIYILHIISNIYIYIYKTIAFRVDERPSDVMPITPT